MYREMYKSIKTWQKNWVGEGGDEKNVLNLMALGSGSHFLKVVEAETFIIFKQFLDMYTKNQNLQSYRRSVWIRLSSSFLQASTQWAK